jgi:hypothetical protein
VVVTRVVDLRYLSGFRTLRGLGGCPSLLRLDFENMVCDLSLCYKRSLAIVIRTLPSAEVSGVGFSPRENNGFGVYTPFGPLTDALIVFRLFS